MKEDKELGSKIKETMEMRGVTQQELADKVGMSLAQINRVVNGANTTSGTLKSIANALEVPVQAFYSEDIQLTTIATQLFNDLPTDIAKIIADKRNLDFLLVGVKGRKKGLTLDEMNEILEIRSQIKNKK